MISAVGHETDWTLIDLAADARAPTPTKAAEWAVPKYSELIEQTINLSERLRLGLRRGLEGHRAHFRAAARGLPRLQDLVALPRQRFDTAASRLSRGLSANSSAHARRLARIAPRLQTRLLSNRLEAASKRLDLLAQRGSAALARSAGGRRNRMERTSARLTPHLILTRIERWRAVVDTQSKLLTSMSYQSVLSRGYALVRDADGRAVRHAAVINAGMALDIEFADGRIVAEAKGTSGPAAAHRATARAPNQPRRQRACNPASPHLANRRFLRRGNQGTLF